MSKSLINVIVSCIQWKVSNLKEGEAKLPSLLFLGEYPLIEEKSLITMPDAQDKLMNIQTKMV